jgi:sugar phosphate isomerase/epimerase
MEFWPILASGLADFADFQKDCCDLKPALLSNRQDEQTHSSQPAAFCMITSSSRISRREMLRSSVRAMAALGAASSFVPLLASPEKRRFKIGACDWSLGKMDDPGAFSVARQIGLDGVQVSMGTAANHMRLREPEVQRKSKEAAKAAGLEVASLAIGELNNIPYKSDPRTVEWVADSIDVCQALGVPVVLLAFFGNDDLRDDKAGTDEVVRRLKAVAPKAEKAGISLGIESWLSANQHLEILNRVGSNAVRVYYDVCNSNDRGYDIYKEIRQLGKLICEFHAKENGTLLGQGKIDFKKVRAAMDDIEYTGWIQIEGAVPPGQPILESYQANCKFMRGIFTA